MRLAWMGFFIVCFLPGSSIALGYLVESVDISKNGIIEIILKIGCESPINKGESLQ